MLVEEISKKVAALESQGLLRKRLVVEHKKSNNIVIKQQKYIDFSSNDYLSLAHHPAIGLAFSEGVARYGFGSGASNFISGYSEAQKKLEEKFSQWLGFEGALLFSSGYLANLGVVSALADRHTTILADKLSHASLLDGVRLAGAKLYRYQHNHLASFDYLIHQKNPSFVLTESVFSMSGDVAPIKEIAKLSEQYGAGLVVDDAHGVGVLGVSGRGIVEFFGLLPQQLTCLILPLGKAFNNQGAVVLGSRKIIDAIVQLSRPYRYTTAVSPAICHALSTAIDVVASDVWRRERLLENINFFHQQAIHFGLNLLSFDLTPIKAIVFDRYESLRSLQRYLLNKNIFVPIILPPTVPENSARIRVSLSAMHRKSQIKFLLENIARFIAKEV